MQLVRADIDEVLKETSEWKDNTCIYEIIKIEIDKLLEDTKNWK
ncbi:MAG TPA: hypothetical protein VNR61_17270 [Niallia sp.]|nr:hypothetical protein [Niallia sp.]